MIKEQCRCRECYEIHSDFILHFGKWPNKTHEEGQALKQQRLDNLKSWDRLIEK